MSLKGPRVAARCSTPLRCHGKRLPAAEQHGKRGGGCAASDPFLPPCSACAGWDSCLVLCWIGCSGGCCPCIQQRSYSSEHQFRCKCGVAARSVQSSDHIGSCVKCVPSPLCPVRAAPHALKQKKDADASSKQRLPATCYAACGQTRPPSAQRPCRQAVRSEKSGMSSAVRWGREPEGRCTAVGR